MNDGQLRNVYQTACDAKGYDANEGQFKIWKRLLGWSEMRDLGRAIEMWYEEETNFPMPAQLKPLVDRAVRERSAKSRAKTDLVRWQCPICGGTCAGFIPPDDFAPRTCKSIYGPMLRPDEPCQNRSLPLNDTCGSVMNEICRTAA